MDGFSSWELSIHGLGGCRGGKRGGREGGSIWSEGFLSEASYGCSAGLL